MLGKWTSLLTDAVVRTCSDLKLTAVAKGNKNPVLPVSRSEYLSLDAVAFKTAEQRWKFPYAVFELENSSSDDLIAYSLWKILCIRAPLRFLFCYRQSSEFGSSLVRKLSLEILSALSIGERESLHGETAVVIGGRSSSETFPYGYFRWWILEKNTGAFRLL